MEEEKQVRLGLDDTSLGVLVKLSEGNPDALTVCSDLLRNGAKIDPDAVLKGLSPLLALDTANIYASRIWMLYKDVCGEDLTRMIAVLRATQLGFLSTEALNHAIDNGGDGVDVNDLERQVRIRLPHFARGKE